MIRSSVAKEPLSPARERWFQQWVEQAREEPHPGRRDDLLLALVLDGPSSMLGAVTDLWIERIREPPHSTDERTIAKGIRIGSRQTLLAAPRTFMPLQSFDRRDLVLLAALFQRWHDHGSTDPLEQALRAAADAASPGDHIGLVAAHVLCMCARGDGSEAQDRATASLRNEIWDPRVQHWIQRLDALR